MNSRRASEFHVQRAKNLRLTRLFSNVGRRRSTSSRRAPSTKSGTGISLIAPSFGSIRPANARTWLDLGSGAGFPGLVLAIMAAETGGTRHILVESDSRKAAFLREVARETRVAVDILCMRIENAETHAKVGVADCVTARALAPLSRLVEIAAPYFASSTLGLFLKGREVAAEIEKAAQDWQFAFELIPSVTEEGGRVVLLKALKPRTEG